MTHRITIVRAGLALVWAAALVLALRDGVPRTDADVPLAAAALLTTYPLIDVAASLLGAGRPARVNAAVGLLAVLAVGVTAFAADAGAAMAAFGAWAVVSGAIQLGLALRAGRQRAMVLSGGLSAVAGVAFLTAAGMDQGHLAGIAGYMAFGAVLFLAGARRTVAAAR